MLKKTKINFTIDSLMLIVMMAIAGIGFLMKFILIPGKERWLVYGTNVELYWLGLDRHEWGTIHLWLGYILLFLLVLWIRWSFLRLRIDQALSINWKILFPISLLNLLVAGWWVVARGGVG